MMRFSLLLELLVLTIGANGYTYYPSVQQTYHFYNTPKTWVEAREQCLQDGANLALPRTDAEITVLKDIIAQNPASTLPPGIANPNYFFMNFHDMFSEGEYVTDKGVALQYYFYRWGQFEPNDALNIEDCGTMDRTGSLNDFPCTTPIAFICQKNKPEIFSSDFRCKTKDSEYKYFPQTKRCYKLHLNPRPWPEARAICKAEGGNLAIINSQIEANVLTKMFNVPDERIGNVNLKNFALLGFHDLFKDGKFVTVEGKDLQTTGYTNWGPNEPNNAGGNEGCGSMYKTGTLNDYSCNTPAVFFCEIGSIYGKKAAIGNGNENGNVSDEDNGQNHTEDDANGNGQNANKKSSRYPR